MDNDERKKEIVIDKYSVIAKRSASCGCSSGCCGAEEKGNFYEDYSGLSGYYAQADLGLGCGLPTESANIKEGDVVVDLGSGAGNDVFICATLVGEKGMAIGVDATKEMITLAEENKKKLGYSNVEFRLGDIENIPLESDSADVVVSNCALNLVPDKRKAFSEIFRILKNGGHFCISDIVVEGDMPEEFKNSELLYAGCVSGAVSLDEYLRIIEKAGFSNAQIKNIKKIALDEEELEKGFSKESILNFKQNVSAISSVTITGEKK